MSFENRLKRGLEARAADMEEDVTTALKDVRARGERRRRMQFAGAAVAAAALLVTGALAGPSILDAIRGTEPNETPIAGDPTPTPSPEPTPQPTPTEGAVEPDPTSDATYVRHTVWFSMGEYLQSSVRFATDAGPAEEAEEILTKLLSKPNSDELSAGYGTAIPDGTELNGVTIEGRTATVDLSTEFDEGGGSLSMLSRVGQVVWTLKPFARDVYFEIDGEPVDAIGGEGVMVSPARARDFADLLAPITLARPYAGATLTDLDIISGTANVFEANVLYRVVDANGNSVLVNDKKKPVEEWFTTAACGTGCRGTWVARIDIDLDEIQEGFLEVYERSAENGEVINLVRIPVTLDPSADGN